MKRLHVTVLGSGTIIPSVERRATALLVEAGGRSYLFDCGPGTLEAVEETGHSFRDLERVFFTHFHPDHTLGIGHLLSALNNDCYPAGDRRLVFYGPMGLDFFLARWNELYHAIVEGQDCLDLVELDDGDSIADGDVRIRAAAAEHGRGSSLAYRVDYLDRSVVFTGDTAYTGSIVELATGTDLLVSECSFPDQSPVEGHMTPSEVGRLARDANVKRVILVHLYPVFEDTDPAAGVSKLYGGPVETAWDGMTIEV